LYFLAISQQGVSAEIIQNSAVRLRVVSLDAIIIIIVAASYT
jgi:hypothetical protein